MNSIVAAIETLAGYSGVYMALISVLTAIMGMWFLIKAFMLLRKMGQHGSQDGLSSVITHVVVGLCLFSFGSFLFFGTNSLFGAGVSQNAEMIFAYAPTTIGQLEDEEFRSAIVAAIVMFQMIGIYGIIKGMTLMVAYNRGSIREIGPVWTHIIAGFFAVNFPAFFAWVEAIISGG